MIHYRCSCSHFPRAHAPAVIDYTHQLIECGLVEETTDDPRRNYRATPMGEAFLELVCRTPLPRLAWVAPTGEVIAYSPNYWSGTETTQRMMTGLWRQLLPNDGDERRAELARPKSQPQ